LLYCIFRYLLSVSLLISSPIPLCYAKKWDLNPKGFSWRHYIRRGRSREAVVIFFSGVLRPCLQEFPGPNHLLISLSLSQSLAAIGSINDQTNFQFSSLFCCGPWEKYGLVKMSSSAFPRMVLVCNVFAQPLSQRLFRDHLTS
jgi:hypothetical protein